MALLCVVLPGLVRAESHTFDPGVLLPETGILPADGMRMEEALKAKDTQAVLALVREHPEFQRVRYAGSLEEENQQGDKAFYSLSGVSLLHRAVLMDDRATAAALIDAGWDVNDPDDMWERSLHYAAWYTTDTRMIQVLLDHGANINATDGYLRTPLQLTCYVVLGRTPETSYLLECGADPNLLDAEGLNALGAAEAAHDPMNGYQAEPELLIALYQHTRHIPGALQLGVMLVMLALVFWSIQQYTGRRALTPELRAAAVEKELALLKGRMGTAHLGPVGVGQHLENRRRYWQVKLETVLPALAVVIVTMFMEIDPILPHWSTHETFLTCVVVYLAVYAGTWLPGWILRGMAQLALTILSLPGTLILLVQGYAMGSKYGEWCQFGMYGAAAALLLLMAVLAWRASGLDRKVHRFEADLQRARNAALAEADATGMDAPAGHWDEGKGQA